MELSCTASLEKSSKKQLLGFTAEEPGDFLLQGELLQWLSSPWGALGKPWGRICGTDTKQGI